MDSRLIYETAKLIAEIPSDRDVFRGEQQKILFSSVVDPSMLLFPSSPGQVLSVTQIRFGAAFSVQLPASNCYHLLFLYCGRAEGTCRRHRFSMSQGQICLSKPQQPLTLSSADNTGAEIVLVRCNGSIPAFFHEVLFPHHPHGIAVSDPSEFRRQLEKLHFLIQKGGADGAVYSSGILSALFTAIYAAGNTPSSLAAPSWLKAIINEVESELTLTRPVTELAARYNISEATLYRGFKEYTGLSPQQYLRQLRLSHACTLLTTTRLQIKYISHAVGFRSVSRFIEQFRQAYGMTPAEYRKASHL